MQILTGTEVQTLLASAGVIPNQEAAFAGHRGNPFMVAADTAATNSRFTPVSPNWPYVESAQVLPEMLVSILSNDSDRGGRHGRGLRPDRQHPQQLTRCLRSDG